MARLPDAALEIDLAAELLRAPRPRPLAGGNAFVACPNAARIGRFASAMS